MLFSFKTTFRNRPQKKTAIQGVIGEQIIKSPGFTRISEIVNATFNDRR